MPWAEVTNPQEEYEIWVRGRDKHINYPLIDPDTGDPIEGTEEWTVEAAWITWPDIEDAPIALTGGNALTFASGVIVGVVSADLFLDMPRGTRSYLYVDINWADGEELLTIQIPIQLKKAPIDG